MSRPQNEILVTLGVRFKISYDHHCGMYTHPRFSKALFFAANSASPEFRDWPAAFCPNSSTNTLASVPDQYLLHSCQLLNTEEIS